MSSTILFKRSNTAGNDAYTGQLGEVTLDTQARKLRVHDGTTVGGHTVANISDITNLQNQIDGLQISDIANLQTTLDNLQSDIDDHETRLSNVETSYVDKDGSVAFTGNVNAGGNKVINVDTPTVSSDAANKGYVDSEISSLGNVFSYEGTITPGTQTTPLDLTTISPNSSGSYYTVDSDGYVEYGTKTEYVNQNDAILFDNTDFRVIDNTNSEISGTLNYIEVSGSTDTGYTIDFAQDVKDRITSLENADTGVSSVSGTSPITVDNTNSANPVVGIDNATTTSDGAMSSSDKSKLDGIESGAEVNTVDSVNGKTGTVTIGKGDVGLSNVDNYSTATQLEATTGTSTSTFMTPQGVRYFVEDGTYTIDGGTF